MVLLRFVFRQTPKARNSNKAEAVGNATVVSMILCCSPSMVDEIASQWMPNQPLVDNGVDEAGLHLTCLDLYSSVFCG